MLTQEEMLAKVRPLLEREGHLYVKKGSVVARPAVAGEEVQTITSDGLETTQRAKAGDMLVCNRTQAGECYLLRSDTFSKRYRYVRSAAEPWAEYEATGRIRAIELTAEYLQRLGLPGTFQFIAAWGSPMIARQGDFLASPEDYSEVYRIAQAEFRETYTLAE